jgi:hypothetical protein
MFRSVPGMSGPGGMRSMGVFRGRYGLLAILVLVVVVAIRTGKSNEVVPHVVGSQLAVAYSDIHSQGLSVTLQHSFELGTTQCPVLVQGSAPKAGTHVTHSYAVTLAAGVQSCSPPTAPPTPKVAVPPFAGRPLSTAVTWAQDHRLAWSATVPPLRQANATTLYANYNVVSQRIAAHGVLALTVSG